MSFNDNLDKVWGRFFERRERQLWDRFPGLYRAVVVETNDPLNLYRVRFKCPELHDHDLKPEHCPWAVSSHDLGGRRTGRWSHPIIKDWIWINFEKGHPYGPVWTGFADPSRRKLYTYPSLFNRSPLSVNEKGDPADQPSDFDEQYLPKDGRPMSHGWQDRYGNLDIHRSLGFFPEEHAQAPPAPDFDAVSKSKFGQKTKPPEENNPDAKYMARVSKYGHILLQGDQGYKWSNEFKGSFEEDEQFEIDRWNFIQKFLNEDEPTDTDQRRWAAWTRYGHMFEMRDVGWNKTRDMEYGDPVEIGSDTGRDHRWIKIRTKGGHLFQAYDKGFDAEEDTRVKRPLLDEVSTKGEHEQDWWCAKDARWMRLSLRHGFKIVLDQRGTHSRESDSRCLPRGNGILLKGRRPASSQGHQLPETSPGVDGVQVGGQIDAPGSTGDGCGGGSNSGSVPDSPYQAGFWWEFNENEESNWTSWGTPLGQTIFMNDKIQNIVMCTRLKKYARPFMGLEENEFQRESPTSKKCEETTHHMKLDLDNEYIRFKTRANKGDKPFVPPHDGCHSPAPRMINKPKVTEEDEHQGFEAHDGEQGDGPWVEVVDAKNRGLWFSYDQNAVILRARTDMEDPKSISLSFDDQFNEVLLRNDELDGKLQIRCAGDIDVVSSKGNINFTAALNINMSAGQAICMVAAGTTFTVNSTLVGTNRDIHATNGHMFFPDIPGGAGRASPQVCRIEPSIELLPPQLAPEDRAKHYNDDFDTEVELDGLGRPVNIEHMESYSDPCAGG